MIYKMIGKEVLKQLPSYDINNSNGEELSVTVARKFIKRRKITEEVVINVRRNKFTIDRFFWCKWGMFNAEYVEYNYTNFRRLREMANKIVDKDKIYMKVENCKDWEIEMLNQEFMY